MRLYLKNQDGLYEHYIDLNPNEVLFNTNGDAEIDMKPSQLTPDMMKECYIEEATKLKVKADDFQTDEKVLFTLLDDIKAEVKAIDDISNLACSASAWRCDYGMQINTRIDVINNIINNIQNIIAQ
jgi:hypothetical protein